MPRPRTRRLLYGLLHSHLPENEIQGRLCALRAAVPDLPGVVSFGFLRAQTRQVSVHPLREDLAVRREALRFSLAHSACSVAPQRDTEMAVSSAVQQSLSLSTCEPAFPSPEERGLLAEFSLSANGCDLSIIPLQLKKSHRLFSIDDMTVEGQAMLKSLLEAWVALSGQDLVEQILQFTCLRGLWVWTSYTFPPYC